MMSLNTTWKIINGSTSVFELKTNHAGTGAKESIDFGHDKVHLHEGSFGHDYGRHYHRGRPELGHSQPAL